MTKNEILNTIKKIKQNEYFSKLKIGLAGSYARGDNGAFSDVDIVVDTDLMSIDNMQYIKNRFTDSQVDVLLLGLLKKEDEEMDNFFEKMDLPINDESAYKNVLKEVIWCE